MNENNPFNTFSLNVCRICLKETNELPAMSVEHINFYRNIVYEVAHEEYNMKTCTICAWMLQRFTKFQRQCQSANNLLRFMDSKSIVLLQSLSSSHHITLTKIETHCYSPFAIDTLKVNGNTNSDSNDTYKNGDDTCKNEDDIYKNENDTYDNLIENYTHKNDRLIKRTYENSVNDTYNNSQLKIIENDDTFKNDNDRSKNDDTYDYDTNDNGILIDNEDEIPLVLLRMERIKKKRKRNKRNKNEMVNEKNVDIKEESDIKQETELSDTTEVNCKRKRKEPRDGFSSRMVQETNEYVVIKLTKEQVLQEMGERSKTDSYTRSLFRCEKCVKGFNFKDVLQKHLEKHSMENGAFQCEMCGQYCPSAVSLRGHVKSHTTRYKCKLCGHVRLSRQHLLEHHAISHTGAPPAYKCEYCQFTTTKRTVMQRHVRNHADGDPHACDKCGKLFKTIESMRLHTARYHDKSSHFQCDRCDKTFVYQSQLRKHVSCVHERREYYCVECDVQFKTAVSLRLHFTKAKRHRDINACKYECRQCPRRFFTRAALSGHLSDVHNAPKSHPCTHCHRFYSSRDAVRAHKWRAHSRRDAIATCAHCDASFARKSTLKLHMRSHAGRCGDSAQNKSLQTNIQDKHKIGEDQKYQNKVEIYTHTNKVI